jgi:outer membrane lipoprotein-sorting protein
MKPRPWSNAGWRASVRAGLAWVAVSLHAAGNPVVDSWIRSQTNVATWAADFVQTRRLPALARPLSSPGHVWFAAPDRFRWELGDPVQSVAIRRGDALLVLGPRLKRAEMLDLRAIARGPMRDAVALLDTGFPRDAAEFAAHFDVQSVREESGRYELDLRPKNAGARRLLAGLGVSIATNDFGLLATELRFADGTILRNDFTNAVRNPAIPAARFDTAVPEGYSVGESTRTNAPAQR